MNFKIGLNILKITKVGDISDIRKFLNKKYENNYSKIDAHALTLTDELIVLFNDNVFVFADPKKWSDRFKEILTRNKVLIIFHSVVDIENCMFSKLINLASLICTIDKNFNINILKDAAN
jgi:hypothetical protein